ncbi:MAG TPA: glycosyltransferase 87 family protein, partial [Gemmatales bacterium]|nr:glycosyltransferase 87 family protein [Gemmatales bacterium]
MITAIGAYVYVFSYGKLPDRLYAGCQAGWAVAHNYPIYSNNLPYISAPLIAVLLVPVGLQNDQPSVWFRNETLLFIWFCVCTVSWFLCNVLLHISKETKSYWVKASLLLLLPCIVSLLQGSPDMLVIVLVLAAWHEWRADRQGGAGLLLATAITLQPICILLLLIALRKQNRQIVYSTMLGLLLTLLLLPALIFGLERASLLNREYLQRCWGEMSWSLLTLL